jgi:uncharacterized protein
MQMNVKMERGLHINSNKRRWRFFTALGTLMVTIGGLAYIRNTALTALEITEMELDLPRLDPEFSGFRLAHISDIHMSSMSRKRLDKIVDRVNSLRADMIAITGDFVTRDPEKFAPDLTAALSRLKAAYGVYTVLGNHDHWAGVSKVREMLKETGIIEQRNTFTTINRNGKMLHIAGIDSSYLEEDRLDLVLDRLPKEGAAILLAHEPDFADESAPTGRFDLQLSGHSHGGQAFFPIIGSPFLPPHARKYPRGLYHINGMKLYTNRGLGTIHFNARINATPEIALFTFCPQVRGNRPSINEDLL